MGNKRLLILLLALIFFIAVIGLTRGERENATAPERFLRDMISWVQGAVYMPVSATGNFFKNVADLRTVYEENQVLKLTLSRYANDVARLNTLEKENERLKEMLDYTTRQKERDDYVYRVANVVGTGSDAYRRTIDIDLGEKDGIREDMAVTTTKGMIGRVIRVSNFFSTVELITSLDEEIGEVKGIAVTALGKELDSFGTILNYDQQEQVLLVSKIQQADPMEVGDTIITSHLGTVYPSGLVIGEVVSREVSTEGLTHIAKVKPAADFTKLREVFVIEVPEP